MNKGWRFFSNALLIRVKHFQNRFWREKKLDFTQAIIYKPYIHIDNFVKDAWLPFDPRVLNFEDPKGKKTWAL